MLDPGDTVNNLYTVIKTLGGGAFGTVYLVNDTAHSGHALAMKEMVEIEIPPGERAEATQLFAREAEILRSLVHPGLPRIFDFFTVERSHYIVMEFIDGETLEEKLKSLDEPFPWEEVLAWAEELCGILGFLHSRKPEPVIFRDLKPSNIMIDADGNVKLIDFGIARHFSPRKVKDTYFMGTPGFSPPEQYGTGQSDPRSDIFALGATMYHLLTKADMEQYRMKLPSLSSLNPSVPAWLESVIMKCLSVNPGERYQSVTLLLKDLRSRKCRSDEEENNKSARRLQPGTQGTRSPLAGAATSFSAKQKNLCTAIGIIGMVFLITIASYCSQLGHYKNYVLDGPLGLICVIILVSEVVLVLMALISRIRSILIVGILGILVFVFTSGILFPGFFREHCQGYLTACESNLKNIGTAMEMYSSDNNGLYPRHFSDITPNYLKRLPACPAPVLVTGGYIASDVYSLLAGRQLYAAAKRVGYGYTVNSSLNCYTTWCQGSYHSPMLPPNMPEYDAVQGLYEK